MVPGKGQVLKTRVSFSKLRRSMLMLARPTSQPLPRHVAHYLPSWSWPSASFFICVQMATLRIPLETPSLSGHGSLAFSSPAQLYDVQPFILTNQKMVENKGLQNTKSGVLHDEDSIPKPDCTHVSGYRNQHLSTQCTKTFPQHLPLHSLERDIFILV